MSKFIIILFSIIVSASLLEADWVFNLKIKSYRIVNGVLSVEFSKKFPKVCNIAEETSYLSYKGWLTMNMNKHTNDHMSTTQAALAIVNSAMLSGKTVGVDMTCPGYTDHFPNARNIPSFTGIHIFN